MAYCLWSVLYTVRHMLMDSFHSSLLRCIFALDSYDDHYLSSKSCIATYDYPSVRSCLGPVSSLSFYDMYVTGWHSFHKTFL